MKNAIVGTLVTGMLALSLTGFAGPAAADVLTCFAGNPLHVVYDGNGPGYCFEDGGGCETDCGGCPDCVSPPIPCIDTDCGIPCLDLPCPSVPCQYSIEYCTAQLIQENLPTPIPVVGYVEDEGTVLVDDESAGPRTAFARLWDCEKYNQDPEHTACSAVWPEDHGTAYAKGNMHCSQGYAFYVNYVGFSWNDRAYSGAALDGCKHLFVYWDEGYQGSSMVCEPACESFGYMNGEISSLQSWPY